MTVYGYLLGFIKVKHFFYKKSCKQKCFFFAVFSFFLFLRFKALLFFLNFILFYPSNLFIVLYYFKVTLPLLFHKQEIKKYTFYPTLSNCFFLIFKERKQLFSLTKKIFFYEKRLS